MKLLLSYCLLLIGIFQITRSQTPTKAIVHFCDPHVANSCGPGGFCRVQRTGNRCQCPPGKMGKGCARPCQDVYKACKRWKEDDRCTWTRGISAFFLDNCPLACSVCVSNGKKLPLALPPILEPIAWFVGRWETRTTSGHRFPESMSMGYTEVLDVQISEVPLFDRPPVNISVTARTLDGSDVHSELGFMTGKPFKEDTGFIEFNKAPEGDDRVAIELASNTGLITIEEGVIRGESIVMEVKFKRSMFGEHTIFQEVKRKFNLVAPDLLEERVIFKDKTGQVKKWLKRYQRTFDYLNDLHEA